MTTSTQRRAKPRRRRMPEFLVKWLDPLWYQLSVRRLRAALSQTTPAAIAAATFSYRGFGAYRSIRAAQQIDEFAALTQYFQQHSPRVIVEIGTRHGGTLFSWIRSNPQAELVVSIDLPGGKFGGGFSQQQMQFFREFVRDRPQTQLEFLRADSHDPATRHELERILAGRPIDALFIDGDHTYAGVSQDFFMYGALVRPGGLIAFHDIKTNHQRHEVLRFWQDIRDQYQVAEFSYAHRPIFGIGVLTVPADGLIAPTR